MSSAHSDVLAAAQVATARHVAVYPRSSVWDVLLLVVGHTTVASRLVDLDRSLHSAFTQPTKGDNHGKILP